MSEENKRVVLVTGASRGLGRAVAIDLVNRGYRVIGTGRSTQIPENWPEYEELSYRCLELADIAGHHEFLRALQKEFGNLYGLVNNGALGLDGVLATMHESEIETLISVNVTGTIILTKYAIRSMLPKMTGRVVNISSIIGTTGFSGLSVYGATKSALQGFTRSLAREIGKAGITVNSVSPGYMQTDMSAGISENDLMRIKRRSPLSKLVEPEDVAAVVRLLMSDEGKHITGVDYVVDAGSII